MQSIGRELLRRQCEIVLSRRIRRLFIHAFFTRYAMLFVEPFPQVNHLASLRTEWARSVIGIPDNRFTTAGTRY